MKLEDYPTPMTDAHEQFQYGRIDRKLCESSFARDLERKLAMLCDLVEAFAKGVEMAEMPRAAKMIIELLEETK